ncbi:MULTISPECIES: PAS domain-containing protein [Mesorhizobium]|uniref:PAS domain-containing protein n=1 Tax=Mesorhizobium denitrificans TaxID=2294114 RepID=A0A371X6K1_9HYPH|nr:MULTISPECIES: PAS domain-containing protein [Mesorhizobium]RFC64841.1 PAS domain-containing protein [Mesorhizobium denitrificans]
MKQDASVELFHYWNRLREGRPAPKRTEVEPAEIKSLLADTFILERDTRGEAVFRLAGTRLCAAYGRELKGFSFASLWRTRDQRLLKRILDTIFTENTVVVVSYDGISASNRSLAFELVILPLDSSNESARGLGLITACERAYWLGADPIIDANVTSVQVFDPSREPLALKSEHQIVLDDRSSDAALEHEVKIEEKAPSAIAKRVRHLLVLDGGRTE